MKRSKGTKHRTRKGPAYGRSAGEFLREVQKLVGACVSSGQPANGEFGVPSPLGIVKVTIRAEMLVHTPGSLIVRPS